MTWTLSLLQGKRRRPGTNFYIEVTSLISKYLRHLQYNVQKHPGTVPCKNTLRFGRANGAPRSDRADAKRARAPARARLPRLEYFGQIRPHSGLGCVDSDLAEVVDPVSAGMSPPPPPPKPTQRARPPPPMAAEALRPQRPRPRRRSSRRGCSASSST